jgi:hypothetical protein
LRSKIDSIRFDLIGKEETGDRGDPDPNRSSIPPGGVGLRDQIKSKIEIEIGGGGRVLSYLA